MPGPVIKLPAQAQGLRPLAKVEPTPEGPGHELDLNKVKIAPIIHVEQEPVTLSETQKQVEDVQYFPVQIFWSYYPNPPERII